MTTPQYVPPEYQKTLSYGPTAVDQKAARAAERTMNQALASVQHSQSAVKAAKTALSKAKTAKAKAAAQKRLASIQKTLSTRQTAHKTAQTGYYQASGQYDKLLTGDNRDAWFALRAMFDSFGLGTLSNRIFAMVKEGYQADTISLLLQDTKEYKERFAGNEARKKAGLPVLSPADYMATEAAYRAVMSAAGLPKGFYDSPTDFTNWIAGDVSPQELKGRVDLAVDATAQADPQTKQAIQQMYGISEKDLTAYFLDRQRALPILQRQAEAAKVGAAALRRGFDTMVTDFERYALAGITGQQAEEGFARIAETIRPMSSIAQRFGLVWDQQQAQGEVFEPGTGASRTGRRLRSQERALFGGASGAARSGLSGSYGQT